KSGKSLSRFFPEVLANLRALDARQFVLDGGLVAMEGSLSFDAPQMRLHPAESRTKPRRIRGFRLPVAQTRTTPVVSSLRRTARGARARACPPPSGSGAYAVHARSRHGQELAFAPSVDGVVAKRLDLPYRAGERAMRKVKCLRTVDGVVGGYRYATGGK